MSPKIERLVRQYLPHAYDPELVLPQFHHDRLPHLVMVLPECVEYLGGTIQADSLTREVHEWCEANCRDRFAFWHVTAPVADDEEPQPDQFQVYIIGFENPDDATDFKRRWGEADYEPLGV